MYKIMLESLGWALAVTAILALQDSKADGTPGLNEPIEGGYRLMGDNKGWLLSPIG